MSATVQSGAINFSAQATVTESDSSASPIVKLAQSLTNGTSSGQFNLEYTRVRSVTNSSTPDDLDLTSLNWNGNDAASAASGAIMICIKNTNAAQKLTVGGGTNPLTGWISGTTPTVQVGKSGIMIEFSPVDAWTVDGSHKILRVATDSASAHSYEIEIWARA
jgi:hypothetical protein